MRDQYTTTTYPIRTLVDEVAAGRVGLPELQRPFVWKRSDVRDLLDSLYQGFPVGQIMTWSTGAEARQIGISPTDAPPTLLLVDGQQRVTSLYAVLHGAPVIDEDYREVTIKNRLQPIDWEVRHPERRDSEQPRVGRQRHRRLPVRGPPRHRR